MSHINNNHCHQFIMPKAT